MLQNDQKIFLNDMLHWKVMKRSSKVKSLKLFYINSNKNTYKYIGFLYIIIWKHKKHLELNTTPIIEIVIGINRINIIRIMLTYN